MIARALRIFGLLGAWSGLALGMGSAAARAQTAYLVKDLTPGEAGTAGTNPVALLPAGQRMFFISVPTEEDNSSDVGELWVTDGTAAGTQRLPCPSRDACSLRFVAAIGDLAFYLEDGQLWRSDGTRAGTFLLTGALVSDPFHHSANPFVVLGGALYFVTYDSAPDPSEQLWRSDGTVAGTHLVADVGPGLYFHDLDVLVAAGDRLFFLAPETAPFTSSADLWTSDGTAQGTGRVTSFQQVDPSLLTAAGSRLFFVAAAGDPRSEQLWVSDGTKTGTRQVAAASSVGWMTAAGKKLVFEANDVAGNPQLWVSDAAPAGIRQVTTGSGFGSLADPHQVAALGSTVVFMGAGTLWAAALGSSGPPGRLCGGGGCGSLDAFSRLYDLGSRVAFLDESLWASDGTPAGTVRLERLCSRPCSATDAQVLGGSLFFPVAQSSGNFYDIWRSDGTPAGTRRFTDQVLAGFDPLTVALLGNELFFTANEGQAFGSELWVSDGTAAGTRQLTDATDPLSSSPAQLTAVGGQIFFAAGTSFWRSAGTAGSTLQLPVRTAPVTSVLGSPPPVAAFGGAVLVGSSPGSGPALQLWRSDGTTAGTLPLTALSPPQSVSAVAQPVVAGNEVYFVVTADTGGAAIWRSDGTTAGTVEAVELLPAMPLIMSLAVFGNDFYMMTGTPGSVTGVWKSDGTPGGTLLLTTPQFGFNASPPPGFVALGGLVYFRGGESLWQTDGTRAGTGVVQVGGISFGDPSDLQVRDGALYLFAATPDGERQLWRTDGTAAGTESLGTFGEASVFATGSLTPFGNGFAFFLDDGTHGYELWVTDGTPAGTRLVVDVQPGSSPGAIPSGLAAAGGRLFFAANDGIHGSELWESDGTAAGTRMVQDINPGPAASNPSGMIAAGGLLFFAADDGLTGRELWALPLAGPGGCQPGATALCLAGGRFKVEAFWRDFQGNSGSGQALALSGDTGTFWFFSPDNLEVVVKVLDGRVVNGDFWVFYGALSDVEYSLTVTDSASGLTRRYLNPLGQLASVGDTTAFGPMGATAIGGPPPAGKSGRREAGAAAAGAAARAEPAAAGGSCQPGPLRLCLNGGRFAVEATWTDFSGTSGAGAAVPLNGETGAFWFFAASNIETVLKVIDGRDLNGHFWVFYGALSNVGYTLTVTDSATGAVKSYTNPAGQFGSVADTAAF